MARKKIVSEESDTSDTSVVITESPKLPVTVAQTEVFKATKADVLAFIHSSIHKELDDEIIALSEQINKEDKRISDIKDDVIIDKVLAIREFKKRYSRDDIKEKMKYDNTYRPQELSKYSWEMAQRIRVSVPNYNENYYCTVSIDQNRGFPYISEALKVFLVIPKKEYDIDKTILKELKSKLNRLKDEKARMTPGAVRSSLTLKTIESSEQGEKVASAIQGMVKDLRKKL